MIELDKNQMDDPQYVENIASENGLINVYAYHCHRCNYTWLPRDFDFNFFLSNDKTDGSWGHDLFYREPPKSCARCKSRSWKEVVPRRKLKLHPAFRGQEWINEDKINDTPWINSEARLRALNRQGKLTPKNILQF